ncbi:MAG: hypothetical protein JOY99_07225 [Sphingomonadaceae bacterium]|nr:hypothetical protein [Sphingomonadaceae bacterium]
MISKTVAGRAISKIGTATKARRGIVATIKGKAAIGTMSKVATLNGTVTMAIAAIGAATSIATIAAEGGANTVGRNGAIITASASAAN